MKETVGTNAGDPVDAKCHLFASGDLTIEGLIEGEINVENALTVGPNAQIAAQIFARVATIGGTVRGNVTAAEKVVLLETASLDGDVVAPRIAIADGAAFNGSVSSWPLTTPSSNGNGRVVPATPEPKPTHIPTMVVADTRDDIHLASYVPEAPLAEPREEIRPAYVPVPVAADPRDEIRPAYVPVPVVAGPHDQIRPAYVPTPVAADLREDVRRDTYQGYSGHTSDQVAPQVEERRDIGYRHVPPPAPSQPVAARVETPSGSVGPYWKRDEVDAPQPTRTLFGREFIK